MKRKAKTLALVGLGSIVVLSLLYWRFLAPESSPAVQRPPSVVQKANAALMRTQTIVRLRPNQEWCSGDLCVMVARVLANPTNVDKHRVDLYLSIPYLSPHIDQVTLTNGDTIFFGPYAITVENVHPPPEGSPSSGSARFFIRAAVTPTPNGPIS